MLQPTWFSSERKQKTLFTIIPVYLHKTITERDMKHLVKKKMQQTHCATHLSLYSTIPVLETAGDLHMPYQLLWQDQSGILLCQPASNTERPRPIIPPILPATCIIHSCIHWNSLCCPARSAPLLCSTLLLHNLTLCCAVASFSQTQDQHTQTNQVYNSARYYHSWDQFLHVRIFFTRLTCHS